jgi:hypothetical protein
MKRALLALLAATACGTTVPLASQPTSDGLSTTPSVTSQPTTSVLAPSRQIPTTASTTTSAAPVIGGPAPVVSTALTSHTPVQVGIGYSSDGAKFGAAFGGTLNTGDSKRHAQTVVNWINAHGGLAGHPIKPVFVDFQLTDPSPWAEREQAMCTTWTQDNHAVAALWVGVNAPTEIAQCLHARGVPFLENGYVLHDQKDFQRWSMMSDAAELEGDTAARTYVEGLFRAGFFAKQDKVGVLGEDYPAAQRVYANALRPQLARHGFPVASYVEIHTPQSTPDISGSVAAIQSAVLKMRSDGVTKVLFLCYGCTSFFMQIAQSQGWNPTYGLSSLDSLWYLGGNAPAGQLKNAKAVGWVPLSDVPEQFAGRPSATAVLCAQILKGQIPSQMPKLFGFNYCDALLTLYNAALPLASLTKVSLIGGIGALGDRYQSALGMHTTFGPAKHWGIDRARTLAFVEACSCFQYTGSAYPTQG